MVTSTECIVCFSYRMDWLELALLISSLPDYFYLVKLWFLNQCHIKVFFANDLAERGFLIVSVVNLEDSGIALDRRVDNTRVLGSCEVHSWTFL